MLSTVLFAFLNKLCIHKIINLSKKEKRKTLTSFQTKEKNIIGVPTILETLSRKHLLERRFNNLRLALFRLKPKQSKKKIH